MYPLSNILKYYRLWSAGSANHRWSHSGSDFCRYWHSRAFSSCTEFRTHGGFSPTKICVYETKCTTQQYRIQLFQTDAKMDQSTVVRWFR